MCGGGVGHVQQQHRVVPRRPPRPCAGPGTAALRRRGRQPAEGNQVVIPTWVVICQHRTGSCYRGRREEFPDQVPPELANLITQHEWMARVVPEVTECLDRFVDPKYYNYLHVLLTIFFALQVSHNPA